jgi:hypothetical protein
MSWARRVACAVGLAALLAAGCAGSGSFVMRSCASWGQRPGDRVVAADLVTVTTSTQKSLRALGINATISQVDEDVHIAWRTATGAKMAFVLTSVKTDQGEHTRIRLDADRGTDQTAGLQLLADLETKHGKSHV